MGKFTLNKTGQQINNILTKAVLTDTEQTITGEKTFTALVSASEGVDTDYIHANDDMTIMAENGAIKLVSADSEGEAVTINDAVATINSKADDSSVVHKTNVEETIYGNKTFRNDTTFEGPTVVKNVNLATFKVQDTAGEHIIYMGTNASNSWISVTDGISEPTHFSSTIGSASITVSKVTDDNITDASVLTDSKLEFQSDFDETYEPTDITQYGKKSFTIVSGSDDLFYVGLDDDNKAQLLSMNDLTIGSDIGSTFITSSTTTTIDSVGDTKVTGDEGVVVGGYYTALPTELWPGHYYNAGTITEPLEIALGAGPANAVYEFEFTTPDTGEIHVHFPTGIRWSSGSEPELQNGYTYVITIRHNLATYMEFAPTE